MPSTPPDPIPSLRSALSRVERLTADLDAWLAQHAPAILIVDDDAPVLSALRRLLSAEIPGVVVACAEGVEEARRMLGLDGGAATVRAERVPRTVGVVLISGMADDDHLAAAARRLRARWVSKPISPVEPFLDAVRAELAAS